jgi:hypothetical protein
MSFPRYWSYDRPPEFVQCLRSFTEARLFRQLQHHAFTIQQPFSPPRVSSRWYIPSRAISEVAPSQPPSMKRRRTVRVNVPQAPVARNGDPPQAELRALQLAAWMRVRVGTAGFICKPIERLFVCRGLQGRAAGKFLRFALQRTCSVFMCFHAFLSMRAWPCAVYTAEAALW